MRQKVSARYVRGPLSNDTVLYRIIIGAASFSEFIMTQPQLRWNK